MANATIIEPLAMTAITAPSGSAAGFDPAVLANDLLGVVWQAPVAATSIIQIDMGADVTFDSIVLLGCGGALSGAQIAISIATAAQGSSFASAWNGAAEAFLAGATMPRSGRGKALWLAPVGAPAAARYIRINLSVLGTSIAFNAGRVIVGKRIQLARNFSFGAARGVRSLGNVDFSVSGVPLVRRGAKLRTIGVTFNAVYNDEVETSVQPLVERVGTDVPIVLITDSAAHADRQNRIYFGYLAGSPGTIQARAGSYQAAFEIVALD